MLGHFYKFSSETQKHGFVLLPSECWDALENGEFLVMRLLEFTVCLRLGQQAKADDL